MRRTVRRALVAASVILLGAGLLLADGMVGKVAPPINAKEWINTPKPLPLKSLRGRIVFLEFMSTR